MEKVFSEGTILSSWDESHVPLSCDRKLLKRLREKNVPYFGKTLTRDMLERLGLPASFVQEHGNKFQVEVILKGPSRNLWSVRLVIRKYETGRYRCDVHFGRGWRAFVKENGFGVGDQLIFGLIGRSKFVVLLNEKFDEEMVTTATSSHEASRDVGRIHINRNDKPENVGCDEAVGIASPLPGITEVLFQDDGSFVSNSLHRVLNGDNNLLRDEGTPPGVSRENVVMKVKSVKNELASLQEAIKAWQSACRKTSTYPKFEKRLTSNIWYGKDARLEIPSQFVKAHGDKFQGVVILKGPSGHLCTVQLRFNISVQDRVQFGSGWKEFVIRNGLREGDVLVFSLVALSRFFVQVFPVAEKGENLHS